MTLLAHLAGEVLQVLSRGHSELIPLLLHDPASLVDASQNIGVIASTRRTSRESRSRLLLGCLAHGWFAIFQSRLLQDRLLICDGHQCLKLFLGVS